MDFTASIQRYSFSILTFISFSSSVSNLNLHPNSFCTFCLVWFNVAFLALITIDSPDFNSLNISTSFLLSMSF